MTIVAIVGLGYVGLPLVVKFGKYSRAIGFDIAVLKAGGCYFCESFFGHPCRTSGKNYATVNAFGCPSRPASLVAYPARGMQGFYAMTRSDFGKPAFSLRKKRLVKTHALSLLRTTRLLSRSGGILPAWH